MKTTINGKGILSISPENELEDYALQTWQNNFRSYTPKDESESTLVVNRYEKKEKKKKAKVPKPAKFIGGKYDD